MEPLKICIIEDRQSIRQVLRIMLEGEGHTVVAEAATLQQAQLLIDSGELELRGVEAVFVDGNLTEGDHTCLDGVAIAGAIKARCPELSVIAFTGDSGGRKYGDILLSKPVTTADLADALEKVHQQTR